MAVSVAVLMRMTRAMINIVMNVIVFHVTPAAGRISAIDASHITFSPAKSLLPLARSHDGD